MTWLRELLHKVNLRDINCLQYGRVEVIDLRGHLPTLVSENAHCCNRYGYPDQVGIDDIDHKKKGIEDLEVLYEFKKSLTVYV